MQLVTLEQIHEDLVEIKQELTHLREVVDEQYEVSVDVVSDIQASRKRTTASLISQEDMRKEFGK